MQSLNDATIDFCDQVSGYKLELCNSLQSLLQCFNVIYLKQQETFYKSELAKDKTFVDQIAQLQQQKRDQDKREKEINQKQEMIKSLLHGKDQEIEALKDQEQQMNKQIEQLNSMIEEQWKTTERKKLVITEDED